MKLVWNNEGITFGGSSCYWASSPAHSIGRQEAPSVRYSGSNILEVLPLLGEHTCA